MPKQEIVCKTCGKVWMDYPSQSRVFCSRACFFDSRSRGGIVMKPRTGRFDPCRVCGTPIWRMRSDVAHDRRWTCSRQCADTSKRTCEWVERNCVYCNAPMGLRRVSDRRRCCSKECGALAAIKNPLERMHNGRPARLNVDGYVLVWEPTHPKAFGGWMYEHRLVAEQMIGRQLKTVEIVHHVNRDKADNRPKNLEVVNAKTHARLTANERMTDHQLVKEYMRRFGPLDL